MDERKKEEPKLSVDDNFIEWCTIGPWFNKIVCQELHGSIFEELFVPAPQYRYDLICCLHEYYKK